MKRFVPSAWVGPALRGVIDVKDKGPKFLSGRTDNAHSPYIDHRIVGDGNVKFALTDVGYWQVSEEQLHDIIAECRKRLQASSKSLSDPNNSMDTANFNMGQ
ncbi:hypothetical protein E8E15_002811 [Penicillium rubens]|uniref:isoflavone reductase family protein n=1 Tax=Penicillium rubens TaxID=1108849 RepID=UPI001DE6BD6B|nr:isoflavone reductase family protein [Penicillium rubens]KAF3014852.1 hypothetical protein E8E15_002811 [Penicillium rubens]KAJ5048637.1 hypothetical protein NUH16_007145 [Penicillium rubens]KAJ5829944.1 isoflavone reductase family protein [Penicillium rubens]KAJ5853528.1 isoflavone reductase family protein [Penicillium rubens]